MSIFKIYSIKFFVLLLACSPLVCNAAGTIKFAPYYDAVLENRQNLSHIARMSGQLDYQLVFVLGSSQGCKPMWGGLYDINDSKILDEIKAVQEMGGKMIIATGGPMGPYIEHVCETVNDLAEAYKQALDAVNTNHLNVNVEGPINLDLMNQALAKVQQERPSVSVTFSLIIQGENDGLTASLGIDVLKNAKQNGVRVDIVNVMGMGFETVSVDFGDAVINAARAVLEQITEIWPEKTEAELKRMLGVTPLIGWFSSSQIFEVAHARKLVAWANAERIGSLSFWSIERDNGKCSGMFSPNCSGINQEVFAFTQIFQQFNQ